MEMHVLHFALSHFQGILVRGLLKKVTSVPKGPVWILVGAFFPAWEFYSLMFKTYDVHIIIKFEQNREIVDFADK